jgi:D-lactate dehydrogenase
MKRITFFEVKPWEKRYLKSKLKDYKLDFFEEPLDDENILKAKHSDIISVFIHSKINKNIIKKMPKLNLILTRSTGFDHIDLVECKKRKIIVSNVPHYGENTVAEHTFALILSLSRNIHKSYIRTLKDDFSIEGLTGFDLKDKILGIIGGGRIGLHVARIARAFGMHVRVYDINKDKFMSEVVNFKYFSLNDLLKASDIISLQLPYNKHTHHIINKENMSKMKKDAILINTSRGGLIDTEALYDALKNKKLAGAGLDVIEGEELDVEEDKLIHKSTNPDIWKTLIRNHKLFKMDNVVFTPHNAFNSEEALSRILDVTIDNINAYLDKKRIKTIDP